MLKSLGTALGVGLVLVALLFGGIWLRYGGGGIFPDRSGEPELPFSRVEKVADLPLPPGNIAVSRSGRIFFSFHPEAAPDWKVAEWVDGNAVAYPSLEAQNPDTPGRSFQSVLSLRIDRQDRLWVLDYGRHGFGEPRLVGFDLATDREVRAIDFSSAIAPWGSHLNDFQIDPQGKTAYIADASIFGKRPALVVVDLETGASRRLLEGHPSVTAERFVPVVQGVKMMMLGVFAIRPGVDSIALDREGEWLYFAPVTNENLYRVRVRDLEELSLSASALGERVEAFAPKTMSDGITIDELGNLYLTDPEHSAIVLLGQGRKLRTLIRDPALRWPDGLGWGPDGWLYITCSALHHVILKSRAHIEEHAPYQIFRVKPGAGRRAPPGQ